MACKRCSGEMQALQEQIAYLRKQIEEKDLLLAARSMGPGAFETIAQAKALLDESVSEDEEVDPSDIPGAIPQSKMSAYLRMLHGEALTGIPRPRGGPFGTQQEH